MERLAEFKPLARLELPGLGLLPTSGLTLIVGPNSCGKSQLLRDIHYRVGGDPRELVVAREILTGKPADLDSFLEVLTKEGLLREAALGTQDEPMWPLTTNLGTSTGIPQVHVRQARQWYQDYKPTQPLPAGAGQPFLNQFGKMLQTALFVDRRLLATVPVAMFDYAGAAPQADLQALFLNDGAKGELRNEILRTFGKAIWLDPLKGNLLMFRVAEASDEPTPEDKMSPLTVSKFRTIDSEGDGLKSYVAVCVAMLLGRRPLCLIDEPEMCLHPPQAHRLGRFIGATASPETATVVATHSSQVLRGALETASHLRIVRLTREGGVFNAHLVPPEVLESALTKPTLKAESILDGIFARAVVVVEADGDRSVYQAAWDSTAQPANLDVHFAVTGGTGGGVEICKLYRSLQIPVAAVMDLDVVLDSDKFNRLVGHLAERDEATRLSDAASKLAALIKTLPPTTRESDVRAKLDELSKREISWADNDDDMVRRDLRRLANDIDRMRRLKRGGIAAFDGELASRLSDLLARCSKIGLFLVPVGELEGWLNGRVEASTQRKGEWAGKAAAFLEEAPGEETDIWAFVRGVEEFLFPERGNEAR